jgi:glycerol uptake facilitator-like aquaporin
MAANLSGGNAAVALLCNAIPTGAILVVLITVLAPLSGAHFNPVVTGVLVFRGMLAWRDLLPYVVAQCAGGIAGTAIAHLMFGLPPILIGDHGRSGGGQWLGEMVATFTLVFVILSGVRHAPKAIPWLVGLTIVAAYWFTSSTSFANPAVTLARGFTTTFAGIALGDVPAFVVAQVIGGALAAGAAAVLVSDPA